MKILLRDDPAELKLVLRHALEKTGGYPTRAAARMGISKNYFWYLAGKLDMRHEAAEIRERIKNRFRLVDKTA